MKPTEAQMVRISKEERGCNGSRRDLVIVADRCAWKTETDAK